MLLIHHLLASVGLSFLGLACSYALLTLAAVLQWETRSHKRGAHADLPPVTLLKPLCGDEPALYEHLRSFCLQDYPRFQIVFGVRGASDPALAVARRIVKEFPSMPIDIAVGAHDHGDNLKISNLINMMAYARHDVLVIADSDTWVARDYLAKVVAPLLDPQVGLVTCLYIDVPTAGMASRLGAMYVNEWYMPSVMLARMFGFEGYVSGQTMGIRRATLQAIGGFKAVVNELADDYRLGELIRARGLRISLSTYVVPAQHDERNFSALIRHELRWMHTIRVLRPNSFRLLFLSFSVPLACIGLLMTGARPSVAAWTAFAATIAARAVVHFLHRRHGDRRLFSDVWLLPLRELLLCWVWCRCFFISSITWRGSEFNVGADGVMHRPA